VSAWRLVAGEDDVSSPGALRGAFDDRLEAAGCRRSAAHKLATSKFGKGGHMHARIATFESDAANVDDAIEMVRAEVESGETPAGLEGAKMLMLVNRETGKGLGITLFESEDAMRRGDEALNAMNPGASERRISVEFYEVPVQTVS
jgi:hypothetical protein